MPGFARRLAVALLFMSLSLPASAATWEPTGAGVALYEKGYEALRGRDPKTAEATFKKLLKEQPACGMAMQGLAYALLFQNRSREAATLLVEATELFPDRPQLWTSLSEASFASQDFARARSAAEEALRLDPESLDATAALQAVLLRVGDYKAAGAALDAAQVHLPGPELACLEAQLRLEQKDVASAQGLLAECRGSAREDLVTMVEGLVAQASGRTAEASQLMGALGVDTMSQVMRAAELYTRGDPAGAAAVLDEVLKSNPERLDARVLRGQARAALGDAKGARADLELAFQGDSWVEVHNTGMMSGILRKSDEEKLQRLVVEGASLLIRLLVEDKDLPRARAVLTQARKLTSTGAALEAAEAWLLSAEGKDAAAWKILSDALVRGERDPLLREIAGQMAYRSLQGAPPVVLASIRAQGPASARLNLASALANASRPADCLAEVVATPQVELLGLTPELRQRFDRLGYRCAVEAEDLAAADARLFALGTAPLDTSLFAAGFNHALMLSDKGEVDGTLAVLDRLTPGDKRSKQKVLSLQITTLAGAGRWDQALQEAADAETDPQDLAWLAGQVADAGKVPEARGLLDRACPQLSGEAATQCKALSAQLAEDGG